MSDEKRHAAERRPDEAQREPDVPERVARFAQYVMLAMLASTSNKAFAS